MAATRKTPVATYGWVGTDTEEGAGFCERASLLRQYACLATRNVMRAESQGWGSLLEGDDPRQRTEGTRLLGGGVARRSGFLEGGAG
jgi:hypothetical protein